MTGTRSERVADNKIALRGKSFSGPLSVTGLGQQPVFTLTSPYGETLLDIYYSLRRCSMKQFNEWFSDTYGCTIEQFKKLCGLYHTPDVDGVFKAIKNRYHKEFDKEALDTMDLTFADWLEGYYGLTVAKLHEIAVQTGTPREERLAYEWYLRRYQQEKKKELIASNPFTKQEEKTNGINKQSKNLGTVCQPL